MANIIDSSTSGTPPGLIAPPGLKGLVVAETSVGSVRGAEGFFHYRDHDAVEIARHHTLEAAAHLLIDGVLPNSTEESAFRAELAASRRLSQQTLDVLQAAGSGPSPMSTLRAALAVAADDTPTIDLSPAERKNAALAAAAKFSTILAATHRLRLGLAPLEPDPALGHAADYARMVTGAAPTPRLARALETYLLLTLDHGFNASTFTARVVTSTGAGVSSALCAAVGALSGPLHGGAPSRVLDMLDAIGEPANTESWARQQLDSGAKLMGFGHAVYRAEDPRSNLLREVAIGLGGELVERAAEVEARMLPVLQSWKPSATIVTNVEFYAAVVLHLVGIPQEMFSPTFATSRVIGWAAHLLEQAADNKIMRPSARYVGPLPSLGV